MILKRTKMTIIKQNDQMITWINDHLTCRPQYVRLGNSSVAQVLLRALFWLCSSSCYTPDFNYNSASFKNTLTQ